MVTVVQLQSQAIVKGDSQIAGISAASIVAKVHLDHEMVKLHSRLPEYGFDRHKDSPTSCCHLDHWAIHGITKYHRQSFNPIYYMLYARKI